MLGEITSRSFFLMQGRTKFATVTIQSTSSFGFFMVPLFSLLVARKFGILTFFLSREMTDGVIHSAAGR